MKYEKIKFVAKPVSRLVMGTMILSENSMSECYKLLDDVYALGVNTFDTAAVYGNNSEGVLGSWINSRQIRNDVVILTKGAHHNRWRKRVTPFDIQSDLHDSLAKMDTPYVDIYMLHRDDPSVPVCTIVDCLNRMYDSGKIKSYGGSNWTHERIDEANEYACKYGLIPFSSSSPNYSLARQIENPWGEGCVTLSGEDADKARNYYQRTNMPVFAYSSLGRGFFSGKVKSCDTGTAMGFLDSAAKRGYLSDGNFQRLERAEILAEEKGMTVPQIATAWLMHQPINVFALVGVENGKQMEENAQSLDVNLSQQELDWLDLKIDLKF